MATFSERNKAAAVESSMRKVAEMGGRKPIPPQGEVAPSLDRGPYMSFSITKKVGDAEIHASGSLDQIAAAKEKVGEAARRLREGE